MSTLVAQAMAAKMEVVTNCDHLAIGFTANIDSKPRNKK